jgi:hypothetical protein
MVIGGSEGERLRDMAQPPKVAEVRKYGTRFAVTYARSTVDGGE